MVLALPWPVPEDHSRMTSIAVLIRSANDNRSAHTAYPSPTQDRYPSKGLPAASPLRLRSSVSCAEAGSNARETHEMRKPESGSTTRFLGKRSHGFSM